MKQYTITLTDAEVKAMEHVTVDVQEWIENFVKVRARQAINDIYKAEVERMVNDPSIETIPANKEEVVLSATIKTAAEMQAEHEAEVAEDGQNENAGIS